MTFMWSKSFLGDSSCLILILWYTEWRSNLVKKIAPWDSSINMKLIFNGHSLLGWFILAWHFFLYPQTIFSVLVVDGNFSFSHRPSTTLYCLLGIFPLPTIHPQHSITCWPFFLFLQSIQNVWMSQVVHITLQLAKMFSF